MVAFENSDKPSPNLPPPLNFEAEQIVQEDLSIEPREIVEAQRREKREELLSKPVKKFDPTKRVFIGKPTNSYKPSFSPDKISPRKMADDWERATDKKGRPPIGGAQDD